MKQPDLIPHLFRTEFSRICSVLSKLFGIEHIGTAEDITAETFLAALETWPYKGVPENPQAWLYTVAKNKTKNYLQRNRAFAAKIKPQLAAHGHEEPEVDLSAPHITDSQLQMLFTLCHPAIPAGAQIALSLRILCGFGIDEIATAFLTNREVINKRLFRAKQRLRDEKIEIALPSATEVGQRLDTVLTTLYLLFSEGYYSEDREEVIREDLCGEALRLTYMLITNEATNLPAVNALYALMCFQASRLKSRKNEQGELILYHDQDESLWDQEMIAKGAYYLRQSSTGSGLSKYHLEAGIAYWHTVKEDTGEKWENILEMYNILLQMQYSPVAALNRTYALAKVKGVETAIGEAEKLKLETNYFYWALLGELYSQLNPAKAADCFQKASGLARTDRDRQEMQKRWKDLDKKSSL